MIDGDEIVGQDWFTPAAALEAHARGELDARLPDDQAPRAARRRSQSAAALLDYASGPRGACPVEPRVVREGEIARVVLPGEPGYDDGPQIVA